jgi:hypothetical protein
LNVSEVLTVAFQAEFIAIAGQRATAGRSNPAGQSA